MIFSENIINEIWSDFVEQKFILLGCLEKLDIICKHLFEMQFQWNDFQIIRNAVELRPYIQVEDGPDVTANTTVPKLYFFPWITRAVSDNEAVNPQTGDTFQDSSFQLVIDFNHLPVVRL